MVKVGIVGCGAIAQHRHAPEYAANPNCQLVGLVDNNMQRAQQVADQYGAKVYESFQALLQDPEIDAVSICSANKFHPQMAIDALQAGKHVLCEKPMAMTQEECLRMVQAAQKTDKRLMIAHNQRLTAVHQKAKELLDSGEMGKIITFATTFGHRGPETWSVDKGVNTWFFKKETAILGATADLGIHKMDLIRYLVGKPIASVSAVVTTLDKKDANGNPIEVDDNAAAIIRFADGPLGTLAVSWTHYGEENNKTQLYCEKGIIKMYDNPDYPLEVVHADGKVDRYQLGKMVTNEDEVQENSGVIDMFIDAILDETKPYISAQDAYESMRAIFACVQSSETGNTIWLDR